MISVWLIIPAVFIGVIFGIMLMAIVSAGKWKDDD